MNRQFSSYILFKMYQLKKKILMVGFWDFLVQNIPILEGIVLKLFFDYLSAPNATLPSPYLSGFYLLCICLVLIIARKIYFRIRSKFDFFLSCDIRVEILLEFFNKYRSDQVFQTGRLINSAKDDVDQIVVYIGWLVTIFCQLIRALVVLFILMQINMKVTVIAMVPIILLEILAQAFGRIITKKREHLRQTVGDVNSFLVNLLQAVNSLKVFNKFDGVLNKYEKLYKTRENSAIKDSILSNVVNNIYNSMGNLCLIMSILAFSGLFMNVNFSLGDFTIFIAYSFYITDTLESLGNLLVYRQQTKVSFLNIKKLFLVEKTSLDNQIQESQPMIQSFKSIEIKRMELNNLNTTTSFKHYIITHGDKVLIGGESGKGKTTVLQCLLGLIDSKCELKIQTVDGNYQVNNLAKLKVAYIPQKLNFFNDTFIENLTLGNEVDFQQIETLLNKLCLLEEVNSWENGLKQAIGINGSKLSGGQQQRLALASGLLYHPDILILDDTTTGLDNDTFKAVWQLLLQDEHLTLIVASSDTRLHTMFSKKIIL